MKWKSGITFLAILLTIPLHQVYGQETALDSFEIRLKSRHFTPPEEIALGSVLSGATGERVHILIQFKSIPDSSVNNALKNAGIKLLNYVPQNTWFASVPRNISPTNPALSSVRWFGRILPEDKVAPGIIETEIGIEEIDLVIKYFNDADIGTLIALLDDMGATIHGQSQIANSFTISVGKDKILSLANDDCIRWIERAPSLSGPEASVSSIRSHVGSSIAQSSFGLDGTGVTVGIFEVEGHAYGNHQDLSGRLDIGDTDPTLYTYHATNVAGIIGGDGSITYDYRGMAPNVDMYSYFLPTAEAGGTDIDHYLDDLQLSISTHHIDIANNSWGSYGCSTYDYGNYEGLAPYLDGAVRGDLGKPVTIIFSGGNERYGTGDWDDANQRPSDVSCLNDPSPPYLNYGTINHPKPAKNTIVVGAIDSYNDNMSTYSSWGPTDDGRIKPEIVASGHDRGTNMSGVTQPTVFDDLYLAPYYPDWQGDYGYFGYTSCAAAVASGSIALLFEDFRNNPPIFDYPLPSTIKALLIHSARDLDDSTSWYNKGPDYASGYGLLQIDDAIDLKRSDSVVQSQLENGEEVSYFFTVPANASSVKVTLAWDDFPAVENADTALVNDLNLYVIDDQGIRHHPWTLDKNNPSTPADRQTGIIPGGVDNINNVEQVVVDLASTINTARIWRVVVEGYSVPQGPQKFSLVANEVNKYQEMIWNTMELAPGGRDSSLAMDANGNPHIAHAYGYTPLPQPYYLEYLWKESGTWNSETDFMIQGRPISNVSMALDSNGNTHIVFQMYLNWSYPEEPHDNILGYAHKVGDSWSVEQLTPISQNPIFCSLAVDLLGNPHIAYTWLGGSAEENTLKYTYKSGGTWHTEEPDPGVTAFWPSIAVDRNNRPHIAYEVDVEGTLDDHLKYARKITSWFTTTVDDSGNFAYPSLALNSQNIPHIIYHGFVVNTNDYGDIKHAWQESSIFASPWEKEIVIPAADLGNSNAGRYSSIAIDSYNYPHIAYYAPLSSGDKTLGYARRINGSWFKETVDGPSPLTVGRFASLALDSEDKPHIAYQTGNTQTLHYASTSGQSAQSATGAGAVTFSSDAGQLSSVSAVSEQSLPEAGKPAGITFPFGFFSWTVTDLEPGQTFTLTMVYPSDVQSPAHYWKVIDGVWTDVTSLIGDDDGDNVLTFTGTDGGLGDADNSVNGEYSDPGGVAMPPLLPGDLDGDRDVDRDDLNIILAARNTSAEGENDPRDLDGDGMITVLDARILVTLCTLARCAVQ